MSYIIPTYPQLNDWATVVYIDPSQPTNGDGTIGNPYNTLNGIGSGSAIPSGTAYLIKRGTTLNERLNKVFINSYVGSYDNGEKPIVSQGCIIKGGSNNFVLDGLDVRKVTSGALGADHIISGEATPMTDIFIVNSTIQGIYNPIKNGNDVLGAPVHYPMRGIRTTNVQNFTIFNNIIRNIHDDGVWIASTPNLKIVQNWIYNINRGGYDEATGTWYNIGGDCIQLEYSYANLYLAGNRLDKSNTTWKFAFIINSGWDNTNRNIIAEYNTFVGSMAGNGGAVVYWNAPQQSIFRYNILDGTRQGELVNGVVPLTSSHSRIQQHLQQSSPYGVYNNHIIKPNNSTYYTYPNFDANIPVSNVLHTSYSSYESYMASNPSNNWGAPEPSFWTAPAPIPDPEVDPPIILPEVVTPVVPLEPITLPAISEEVKLQLGKIAENINHIQTIKDLDISSFDVSDINISDTGAQVLMKYNTVIGETVDAVNDIIVSLELTTEQLNTVLLEAGITEQAFIQSLNNRITEKHNKILQIVAELNTPPDWYGLFNMIWMEGNYDGDNLKNTLTGSNITITGKDFSTDYIPITSNAIFGFSTPKTALELVSEDYPNILVKYDNTAPHHIRMIGVLKDGITLTQPELDQLHQLFDLWIWWSGEWNDYGVLKDNRNIEVPEQVEYIPNGVITNISDGVTHDGMFFSVPDGVTYFTFEDDGVEWEATFSVDTWSFDAVPTTTIVSYTAANEDISEISDGVTFESNEFTVLSSVTEFDFLEKGYLEKTFKYDSEEEWKVWQLLAITNGLTNQTWQNMRLPVGEEMKLSWGDGDIEEITGAGLASGGNITRTHNYDVLEAGTFKIKVSGNYRLMTRLEIPANNLTGNIDNFAEFINLTTFYFNTNNFSGGTINGLADINITGRLYSYFNSNVSIDVSKWVSLTNATHIWAEGESGLSGSLNGDVSVLRILMINVSLKLAWNQNLEFNSTVPWNNNGALINLQGSLMTSTFVDNALIAFAGDETTHIKNSTITLSNCAVRTSISDAAVAAITTGRGNTLNPPPSP
jgi:hypothetical protein